MRCFPAENVFLGNPDDTGIDRAPQMKQLMYSILPRWIPPNSRRVHRRRGDKDTFRKYWVQGVRRLPGCPFERSSFVLAARSDRRIGDVAFARSRENRWKVVHTWTRPKR